MNKHKLMGLIGALAVVTLILVLHLWGESRTGAPESVPPVGELALDQVAGDAWSQKDPVGQDFPDPAPAEIPRQQPGPGGHLASVVYLKDHGFQPVNFAVRATSSPLNLSLTQSRPQSVRAEQGYEGNQIWYGVLRLGTPLRDFPFALDLTPERRFHMWFDANANGDLTDDPGPLKNQGSGDGGPGGFATVLRVPWNTLSPQSGFDGAFEIWFYSNKSGWENGHRASHYSRTQLKGEAVVGGRRYLAWIADSGYNDADLTNDGLLVDLNGNGKADSDEWFADMRDDGKFAASARGRVEVHW